MTITKTSSVICVTIIATVIHFFHVVMELNRALISFLTSFKLGVGHALLRTSKIN